MPSPITHIAFTEKIYDKFFKDKDRKEFFIGTIFPDIRYLGVIERSKTHFEDLRLRDLEKDNPFTSGLKFHSITDEIRDAFMISRKVYSFCPKLEYINISLKFLEDQILYEKVGEWDEYIKFLDVILPDELSFDIKKKDIRKWHVVLQKYFKKRPNQNVISKFASKINLASDVGVEIKKSLEIIKSIPEVNRIIKDLFNCFEEFLNNKK